jgi:hypothetical protein
MAARVERAELAARVLDTVRAVAAVDAVAATEPVRLGALWGNAERVTRDAAEAFVALAGLLYPDGESGCPSGEGWAFIDALRSARSEGAETVRQLAA